MVVSFRLLFLLCDFVFFFCVNTRLRNKPSTAHSVHATQGAANPRPVFGRLPLPNAILHAWLLLSIVLDRIITGKNTLSIGLICFLYIILRNRPLTKKAAPLRAAFRVVILRSCEKGVGGSFLRKDRRLVFPLFLEAYIARSAFSNSSSSGAAPSMRPMLSVMWNNDSAP